MEAATAAQDAAATKLQSVHRGGMARSRVHERRVQHEVQNRVEAAMVIQRNARGRQARKRVRTLEGARAGGLTMEEIQRMEAEEEDLQAEHDALMGNLGHQRLSDDEAVTRLQALQRGRNGRQHVHQLRERKARQAVPPAIPYSGRPQPIRTPIRAERTPTESPKSPIAQQLQHKLSLVRGEIDAIQQKIVQCLGSLDDDALSLVTQLNARVDNLVKIERQVAIAIEHRQRLDLPPVAAPNDNASGKAVRFASEHSPASSGQSALQLAPLQGPGLDNHRYHDVPRSGGSRSNQSDGLEAALSHRERLVAFYRQHNPAMLDKVDAILAKYRGHEEVLFHKLARKYATSTENSAKPSWDNAVGNKKRTASDIAGRNRAEEVSSIQKQSLRTTEHHVMGRLLRNQIELENRVQRMAPGGAGGNGLW